MTLSFRSIKYIGLSILFVIVIIVSFFTYFAFTKMVKQVELLSNDIVHKIKSYDAIQSKFISANKIFFKRDQTDIEMPVKIISLMNEVQAECNFLFNDSDSQNENNSIQTLNENAQKIKMIANILLESISEDGLGDPYSEVITKFNSVSLSAIWESSEINEVIHHDLNQKIKYIVSKKKDARTVLFASIAVSIILFIIISIFMSKGLSYHINNLILAANKAAKGDFTTHIDSDYHDEIGKLTLSFNRMIVKLQEHTSEMIEKNIELFEARIKADAANKAKNDFLANISHEVRTPLNVIIGMTDLLDEITKDEKQKEYIKFIKQSNQHLLDVMNDILDFVKLGKIKEIVVKDEIYLDNLIASIVDSYKFPLSKKQMMVNIKYADNLPNIIILDKSILRQIIINLFGNAVKFTHEGFIKVELKADEIDFENHFMNLYIIVKDSGIGIPKEKLNDIFTMFNQLGDVYHKTYDGIGLGLSLCKKLVEKLNGDIKVSSVEGKGSTFEVKLSQVVFVESQNVIA